MTRQPNEYPSAVPLVVLYVERSESLTMSLAIPVHANRLHISSSITAASALLWRLVEHAEEP